MFARILVPLDGSPESNVGVKQASAIARVTGAAVTLLRVYASGDPLSRAVEFLNNVAREYADPLVVIDVAARLGNPAEVILEQVDQRQADLVVMRTRGRAGLSRAVLGSVAEEIVKRSPTLVLLIAPEARVAEAVRTIHVPVDGSPGGALALGVAHELALATGARLRLLQVIVPVPIYLSQSIHWHGPVYIDPMWDRDAEAGARTYLASLEQRLARDGIPTEGQVLVNVSVGGAIVGDAAEHDADLIVMSSEAHTGAARALFGSVTDEVVRTATCPVLVLRRPSEPGHGESEAPEVKLSTH
jgi:nucleotide-binding universal stress UspA family protein